MRKTIESILELFLMAIVLSFVFYVFFSLSGCVSFYGPPRTEIDVELDKEKNLKTFKYNSTKDQNIEIERGNDGKIKSISVKASASDVEASREKARQIEADNISKMLDKIPNLALPLAP